jgi:hypothetical protein
MRETASVPKKLWTTREAAERLSVSIFTVRNLAELGALPVVKVHADEQDALPPRGRGAAAGVAVAGDGAVTRGVEVIRRRLAPCLYADAEGGLHFQGKDPEAERLAARAILADRRDTRGHALDPRRKRGGAVASVACVYVTTSRRMPAPR